jgi:hypothetical protein
MAREYNNPEIPDLRAALELLTVDKLKELLNLLPSGTKATRKADLIAVVEHGLSGEKLKALWEKLDETQKLAVAETIYSADGYFNASRFKVKYGVLPLFENKKEGRGYGATPTVLRLFIHPASTYGSAASGYVPEDLNRRLASLVKKPTASPLPLVDELPDYVEMEDEEHEWQEDDPGITLIDLGGVNTMPAQPPKVNVSTVEIPLIRRDTEVDALAELTVMLRLIDQGKLAVSDKTYLPGAAALRELGNRLNRGDFYPPEAISPDGVDSIGPIKAFAWPLLLQTAGLAELHGKKLALTKTGRAALGKPVAETLRLIWQRWMKGKQFDEFNRIDAIKGQTGKGKRSMTSAAGRRAVIEASLKQCPPGAWINFEGFSRYMKANGHDFEITREPWDLYIAHVEYGSFGHWGFHDWHILQKRYLACLLFEYAATLGLIDVAYIEPWEAEWDFGILWGVDELDFLSGYDGLMYFRLNPLGAYCLGLADTYQPSRPQTKTVLQVLPSLHVSVVSGSPTQEEGLFLGTWAERNSETLWRLDRGKILESVERGQRIAELRDFLTARDDQGLPETVEGFLAQTSQQANALKNTGTVLLIECQDEAIAELIATHEQAKSISQRVGPTHFAVKPDAEERFRQAMHSLGYGMPRGN